MIPANITYFNRYSTHLVFLFFGVSRVFGGPGWSAGYWFLKDRHVVVRFLGSRVWGNFYPVLTSWDRCSRVDSRKPIYDKQNEEHNDDTAATANALPSDGKTPICSSVTLPSYTIIPWFQILFSFSSISFWHCIKRLARACFFPSIHHHDRLYQRFLIIHHPPPIVARIITVR
ncbi:hypothetical protein BDQ12DRAFT_122932 [Crucibulum laeve]|uniref:Uncharacterized protein n=1 Tax=Crucibulum laeve TaxID=68775 RepID=A0A5C3M1Y4_9AGAR|nr:hypothetical protein BDQ12DRAFT_122932 [Crucibulum laeve]